MLFVPLLKVRLEPPCLQPAISQLALRGRGDTTRERPRYLAYKIQGALHLVRTSPLKVGVPVNLLHHTVAASPSTGIARLIYISTEPNIRILGWHKGHIICLICNLDPELVLQTAKLAHLTATQIFHIVHCTSATRLPQTDTNDRCSPTHEASNQHGDSNKS